MPIECLLLSKAREVREYCPKCGARFEGFLRGMVHSFWKRLFNKPYCAVICRTCKEIVGWEKP